ncbi:MAG: ABATE domain-containing protein [Acidobacteria bacterium]|nr:ABATE domain-containing protein [Acidobacteriota bacterium]
MSDPDSASRFEFTGGALCLDFANTIANRPTSRRADLVPTYEELLQWAGEAGLLSPEQMVKRRRLEAENPQDAQNAWQRAVRLREAVYEIFAAVARKAPVSGQELEILNENLRAAAAQSVLRESEGRFVWEFSGIEERVDSMLWPIARSAAELLLSPDVQFVRECAADTCAWLFVDKTKNHRRRWCDMKVCGNRAKARRFYARQRPDS